MDERAYERWSALHRRSAMGERLTVAEREEYEAGCGELDAEEALDGDIARLKELRGQILEAEVEQTQLRDREADIDRRIAALEDRLDKRTRELLGIGR